MARYSRRLGEATTVEWEAATEAVKLEVKEEPDDGDGDGGGVDYLLPTSAEAPAACNAKHPPAAPAPSLLIMVRIAPREGGYRCGLGTEDHHHHSNSPAA